MKLKVGDIVKVIRISVSNGRPAWINEKIIGKHFKILFVLSSSNLPYVSHPDSVADGYSFFENELELVAQKTSSINDSGQRAEETTGALTDPSNSLEAFELLSPYALFQLSAWLGKGAMKYTKNYDLTVNLLGELCTQEKQNVIRIDHIIAEGSAVLAMKKNYGESIQILQKDKGKIDKNGVKKILIKSWQPIDSEALTPIVVQEINEQNFWQDCDNSTLQKSFIKSFFQRDVVSAVRLNSYTLTTTLKQENLEEYFVVSTTTASECWEILLKELKKRCLISNLFRIENNQLIREGRRNWEKGIKFSICVGKLQRHLQKWIMGQNDEDHLAAVGFWWHALSHYEALIKRGVLPKELDDLPRYENK